MPPGPGPLVGACPRSLRWTATGRRRPARSSGAEEVCMRRRTLIEGVVLLIIVGLLVDHGGQVGSELPQLALFGAVMGAVVALVPHRSAAGRAGAFAAGFGAAYLGFVLRAAVLPAI